MDNDKQKTTRPTLRVLSKVEFHITTDRWRQKRNKQNRVVNTHKRSRKREASILSFSLANLQA